MIQNSYVTKIRYLQLKKNHDFKTYHDRKVLCTPGPKAEYFEHLFCRLIYYYKI